MIPEDGQTAASGDVAEGLPAERADRDPSQSLRGCQRILILEDAAYRELRYSGPDLPSLKRFDPHNEFVVYAGTFSKSLAPWHRCCRLECRSRKHFKRRRMSRLATSARRYSK